MYNRRRCKVLVLLALLFLLILLANSSWFIKLFYPFPHKELIENHCEEYNVDKYLVLAVIKAESRFYTKAQSRSGARGLMQIMPETGIWIAEQTKQEDFAVDYLYQPEYNIPMGIWYLSYLDKMFQGNIPEVLAAYNAGEKKVRDWVQDGTWTGLLQDVDRIPYAETREYIDKVLFDYHVYKRVYKQRS